jgi:hypothetical protein
MRPPRSVPDEIDSEQLLAQGDELLKSSRRLLDQIGEIDLRDDETDATEA